MKRIYENLTTKITQRGANLQSEHHPKFVAKLGSIGLTLDALQQVVRARDPYMPDAVHKRRVLDASQKAERHIAKINSELNEVANNAIVDISARMEAKVGLKPSRFDAEIRSAHQGKKIHEKLAALQTALDNDDTDTLAAFLLAPKALTGLEKEHVTRYMQALQMKKAPDEHREMEAIFATLSDSIAAAGVARKAAIDAADPAAVEKADTEAKQAADALAGLNDALK